MIEANELRIGNYIKDIKHNRLVQYHSIEGSWNSVRVNYKQGSGIYTLNLENSILQNKCQIEPIPLTEEILLKCGFEKEENKSFAAGTEVIFYTFKKDGFIYNTIQQQWWFGNQIETDIDYLHELQNIYYWSKNKKELEIKL